MPKSSSVAGADVRASAVALSASPTSSTPCSCSASATRGTNASATAACTTSDSAALHTLVRCVFALTTIVERLVEIGGGVDVDVTVAVAVDDHRHRRVVADALDERRAAARDQAVDVVGELHHLGRGLVRGVFDEDHRVFGQPVLGERVAQHRRDRDVRAQRGRRARAAAPRCPAFTHSPAASLVTLGRFS